MKSKLLTIGVVFWIEFSFVKMEFFFPCWIPTEGSYVDTRTCEWYVLDNRVCRCKIMIHAFKRDNWMNSLSKRTVRDRVIFDFFSIYVRSKFPYSRILRIDWYHNFRKIRSNSWPKGFATNFDRIYSIVYTFWPIIWSIFLKILVPVDS